MRLLFCCEFYHPSRGGVQEVMRQIAERMVLAGHEVTVATTELAERDFAELNGVRIVGFKVIGNLAHGLRGEVKRYREFVRWFDADAILIKAAQQWTFDALWPVIDEIRALKAFIPCGFSGLYEPAFSEYFKALPDVLRKFDHLIFYAEKYRDIDFARAHSLTRFTVLPNGASELEFSMSPDPAFRARLGISNESFVFLTVGSPISMKGHAQVAEAFARLDTNGRPATLILNGNWQRPSTAWHISSSTRQIRRVGKVLTLRARHLIFLLGYSGRVLRDEGWSGFAMRVRRTLIRRRIEKTSQSADKSLTDPRAPVTGQRGAVSIDEWIQKAKAQSGKQVLCTNMPRSELIDAFMIADLFVFASVVEYSPLVLFEAAAAGTAFLSTPVGNAEEIAHWTGGGIICPAKRDERGYTRVDPTVLMDEMQRCMRNPNLLARLGAKGKDAWRREFTWAALAPRYEAILSGQAPENRP
jgi:glycosyltransferase involved in cell wall biosynthesis